MSKASAHPGLTIMNGIGRHVKNTVINRNVFLPHESDKAPIKGALKKERNPCKMRKYKRQLSQSIKCKHTLIPTMIPFIRNVSFGKVLFRVYRKKNQ